MTITPQHIISLIDLTSLNEDDRSDTISQLCYKAVSVKPKVAAVCIYPQFISQAKQLLQDSGIPVATVVNFPDGGDDVSSCVEDIKKAIKSGANEIDVVLPYQHVLDNDCDFIETYLHACRKTADDHTLKIILESGALMNPILIKKAAEIAVKSGADFIKTSTGKIATGATLEAVDVMLSVIKHHNASSKKQVGIKISGGVRTPEQAQSYLQLIVHHMGEQWITPKHVRIGASKLLDEAIQACRPEN